MRIRVGLVGLLACATLAGCVRTASEPRPDRTLEPSITESSPMPTTNPNNPACTLLTKKDRSDLVGHSMDAEVPVRPVRGSVECIWVHSLDEPARAAIRVVALSGKVWARALRPQVRAILRSPTIDQALKEKLERLFIELSETGGRLAADEICPTYLMLAEARGALRDSDSLFYGTIGSMTAAFGMSCDDGNMILAGYGEYGIGPSIALNRGVIKLLEAAKERTGDIFEEIELEVGGSADRSPPDSTAEPDQDGAGGGAESETDQDASPSPESSPNEADESEDEDES